MEATPMPFPKLKNPLLCQILILAIILGSFLIPVLFLFRLPFFPDWFRAIGSIVLDIGMLTYLLKSFLCLMTVDMTLASLHCYQKVRRRFPLPANFSPEKAKRRIAHFGEEYYPVSCPVPPQMLLYKSAYPLTIYSRSVEKLIAFYETPFLDKDQYRRFVSSAATNARALRGSKTHRFLDKNQRSAPINQVMVVLVFADRVEENFRLTLPDEVCKGGGDSFDSALLPCVVDLEQQLCTFDSLRLPGICFAIAAKNRGISLIRRLLFGGRFPYARAHEWLDRKNETDWEQTLWSYWRTVKKELSCDKKQFQKMSHGDMLFRDGYLYIKWRDRGVRVPVTLDHEAQCAKIENIDLWYYPKANKIAKEIAVDMKTKATAYFAHHGYAAEYITH